MRVLNVFEMVKLTQFSKYTKSFAQTPKTKDEEKRNHHQVNTMEISLCILLCRKKGDFIRAGRTQMIGPFFRTGNLKSTFYMDIP